MKTNWHMLLTYRRNRVASASAGAFVAGTLTGGRTERAAQGWRQRDTSAQNWRKLTPDDAAVSLAAQNFARIKRTRAVLPLP